MKITTAALLVSMLATPALAVNYRPAMEHYLETGIMTWAEDPVIVSAIKAHNALTSGYSADDIRALDGKWRDEIGASSMPTITPVIENAAAEFLRQQVEQSDGAITEIFVMDAQGLNVAASAMTSDYWQGDESKFSQTYGKGADAVHYGDVTFDESSKSYQAQISLTIVDPATGEAIGAMTVGVSAEQLM